ncbi:MAG: rhomboid family intramembrane serine protease [Longimicrobiales bacterium]|nr:rhomboid family intramembrane serine protease [Longimicrobiales bacterium]
MFPLYDDNPTELPPIFTMAIIATCVGVWVWLQGAGFSEDQLVSSVCTWGAIPAELTGSEPSVPDMVRRFSGGGMPCTMGGLTWTAVVTSMFLHGSWGHLIGNMWFLWIFGNNIEDSMGHLRFLAFYLLTGAAAAGAHVLSAPDSGLPMVGASGAISAIMGAYVLLYPRTRIRTLLIIILFITFVDLPAWFFLGYWFLIQVLSGAFQSVVGGGGVAFWAHIGGFAAGLVLIPLFRIKDLVEAKRSHVKLSRDQIRHRGWW